MPRFLQNLHASFDEEMSVKEREQFLANVMSTIIDIDNDKQKLSQHFSKELGIISEIDESSSSIWSLLVAQPLDKIDAKSKVFALIQKVNLIKAAQPKLFPDFKNGNTIPKPKKNPSSAITITDWETVNADEIAKQMAASKSSIDQQREETAVMSEELDVLKRINAVLHVPEPDFRTAEELMCFLTDPASINDVRALIKIKKDLVAQHSATVQQQPTTKPKPAKPTKTKPLKAAPKSKLKVDDPWALLRPFQSPSKKLDPKKFQEELCRWVDNKRFSEMESYFQSLQVWEHDEQAAEAIVELAAAGFYEQANKIWFVIKGHDFKINMRLALHILELLNQAEDFIASDKSQLESAITLFHQFNLIFPNIDKASLRPQNAFRAGISESDIKKKASGSTSNDVSLNTYLISIGQFLRQLLAKPKSEVVYDQKPQVLVFEALHALQSRLKESKK